MAGFLSTAAGEYSGPMPLEIGSADSDKDAKLTVNGGIFMTILGRRSVLSLVIDWFKVIRQ